ncbi:MAG: serine/threonine protein kinase [Azoarcus sp.]|jgi:serine/threonine protein kinase|nr:serine/threonine protein kinase [Azoarcus sp.]
MGIEQDTTQIVPMNALRVGTRLEEFVIRAVIGEGGFGIVYLAYDTSLEREVAIKEYLPGSLATRGAGLQVEVRQADKRVLFQKGMRRFVNEAHILARFRHPALVSVLRFFEANGTAYMVMPYYRGKTLREKVRGGFRAKSTEELFSILLPVLEGLSQIHSVECYHLDISSDNILILENNAPVLLDFGAARHTELSGEDSTTIILKPGFAPIEQYGGMDGELELGPWTDIYAISAVAYLLVTGTMPPMSVSRMMKDSLKPAVDYASPELPMWVLRVIDTGLSIRQQDRQQSVRTYITALLEAAEGAAPPPVREEPSLQTGGGILPMPDFPPAQSNGAWSNYEKPKRNSAPLRWGGLFIALLLFAVLVLTVFSGK